MPAVPAVGAMLRAGPGRAAGIAASRTRRATPAPASRDRGRDPRRGQDPRAYRDPQPFRAPGVPSPIGTPRPYQTPRVPCPCWHPVALGWQPRAPHPGPAAPPPPQTPSLLSPVPGGDAEPPSGGFPTGKSFCAGREASRSSPTSGAAAGPGPLRSGGLRPDTTHCRGGHVRPPQRGGVLRPAGPAADSHPDPALAVALRRAQGREARCIPVGSATPTRSPWSDAVWRGGLCTGAASPAASPARREAGRHCEYERLLAQAGLLRCREATAQEEEETDRPLHDRGAYEFCPPDAHWFRRHGRGRRPAHDRCRTGDEVQGRSGATVEQLPHLVAYSWLFQPKLELPDPPTGGDADLERFNPAVIYAERSLPGSRWLLVVFPAPPWQIPPSRRRQDGDAGRERGRRPPPRTRISAKRMQLPSRSVPGAAGHSRDVPNPPSFPFFRTSISRGPLSALGRGALVSPGPGAELDLVPSWKSIEEQN